MTSGSFRSLLLLLVSVPAVLHSQAETMRVRTASGEVIGKVISGVASFKGVPYAAPPIDTLRWRAPAAAIPWQQPRIADDYGPACTQPLPVPGALAGSRASATSEDCLTLNVWTLARHLTRPMPVMVWIHGGGNADGTAGQPYYDGTNFARDSVVLVSMNYRLGLLGFFAHPALTREAGNAMTANFGLLDQLAALRWVRRNIAAFGGDTGNVTVFGESAGGQDVVVLLTEAASRGLVQHAIAESPGGGWSDPPTLAMAEEEGAQLATLAGLPGATATAAQLRAVPAARLLRAPGAANPRPIIDGTLLTEPPLQAFAAGHAAPIPLIIGTNSNEGSLLGTVAHADSIFTRWLDAPALARVRELYGPAVTDDASFARQLFRDGYFAGPVRWIASHDVAQAPVYLYRFDYVVTPLRTARPGANHGSEIPFVFQSWPLPLLIPTDIAINRAMHDCWIAFARTGMPQCDGLPNWVSYRPADGKLMLITGTPGMADNPVTSVLDVLERLRPH